MPSPAPTTPLKGKWFFATINIQIMVVLSTAAFYRASIFFAAFNRLHTTF
jgi:hypothetical protein